MEHWWVDHKLWTNENVHRVRTEADRIRRALWSVREVEYVDGCRIIHATFRKQLQLPAPQEGVHG